jgi:hypothetical protein
MSCLNRRDDPFKFESAKSAVGVYRDIVGVDPNDRLNVGVDVADKATVISIVTANVANTDDIAGCCHIETGLSAKTRVAASRVVVYEGL